MKHVTEFKEKLNPDKLASTDKIKPKQIIFKKMEFNQVESSFEELEIIKNYRPVAVLSPHSTQSLHLAGQPV